jgi:hypothetical protein
MEDKIRSWAVILLLSLSLGACSTMDRPWDPDISRGESLFDQIPNEDGGALKRCAGHLPPSERKAWQTGRC